MSAETLHRHLVGQQGSRRDLNTPALIVDRDALDRNIAAMARFAADHGLRLRPHAKTHKCAAIAARQIAAGAIGQCCAKIGEAEALAAVGIGGLLLTCPVASTPAIDRLWALNAVSEGFMATVDSVEGVRLLAAAAPADTERPLTLLIDIDPGFHRTGAPSPAAAVAVLAAIHAEPRLAYAGVQFYCGAHQHIADFAERRAGIVERTAYLETVIAALTDAGGPPAIVSGGGTGSHRIDAELGVLTELQVGSYVFMDDQYNACDLTGDGSAAFETSLQIDTRVVSANTPGLATTDAGFKAMATDAEPPTLLRGAPMGARYLFMGDEQGAVLLPGEEAMPLASTLTLAPPHCDPTVNLYDHIHVVAADTLIDIWPVGARGR